MRTNRPYDFPSPLFATLQLNAQLHELTCYAIGMAKSNKELTAIETLCDYPMTLPAEQQVEALHGAIHAIRTQYMN